MKSVPSFFQPRKFLSLGWQTEEGGGGKERAEKNRRRRRKRKKRKRKKRKKRKPSGHLTAERGQELSAVLLSAFRSLGINRPSRGNSRYVVDRCATLYSPYWERNRWSGLVESRIKLNRDPLEEMTREYSRHERGLECLSRQFPRRLSPAFWQEF